MSDAPLLTIHRLASRWHMTYSGAYRRTRKAGFPRPVAKGRWDHQDILHWEAEQDRAEAILSGAKVASRVEPADADWLVRTYGSITRGLRTLIEQETA